MARAPNENVIKACELYKKGIKLVEISKELGIPEGTIRSWKNRYKWATDNATLQKENKKKNRNVAKKELTKKKKKKAVVNQVEEVMGNEELTDKQKLFCVIYSRCLNATKAYQRAYKCTYETAMVEGNRNLRKPNIKSQIDRLIASEFNKEFLKRSVIQKYIDIAFSDVGDYVQFGQRTKRVWGTDDKGRPVPVIDPETGEQKEIVYNYIDLRESTMVDTTLISEVLEGKDGVKFKLLDKMKALDFLTKHCNLLNDEEKTQLDIENKKLQNMKLETDIQRIKSLVDGNEEDEVEDDGFIKALEGKVDEVWEE
ncbi:terminase small subunit [Clostridium sp.]|uniref:terminase small subunit n=1 Tax=Clostridium sp. TaxID=1506 RepID=UPI002913CCDE|nr:terminase small subunit [Clostridium sp.]MDU4726382.1 terminase small subunit [Clostridium sp.]